MKQPTALQRRMLENIYDIVKVFALSETQDDAWAEISRSFAEEAGKEMHKFIKNKELEWDGDKHEIHLGKHFVLKLEIR